jgi:hypothetical protein
LQDVEKLGRDADAAELFGVARACDREAFAAKCRDAGERSIVVAKRFVRDDRKRRARPGARGIRAGNDNQTLGFMEREGTQQERVDDAEDGGVRAYSERQREHRDGRKAGALAHHADTVTETLQHKKYGAQGSRWFDSLTG